MAYRNDVDALAARHEVLQAEVDAKTRDRDEVSRLLEEARGRERNEQLYQDYASGGPQRRRRRRVRIALALAALMTGMLGIVFALRVTPRRFDRSADVIAKMQQLADDMCQCRDRQCTERVVDEMMKWSQDQARSVKPPRLSEQDMRRAEKIGLRMGECMGRAIRVEAPEPPPHAQRYESQSGM
jgi:hypothetical protein